MTGTTTASIDGNVVPDFSVVEKSGLLFEWTWNDVKTLNADIRFLVKSKIMPKPKYPPQRLLILCYWLTVIGGFFCLAITISLIRDEIQGVLDIIVAGMVFGATSIGIIFFVCLIIRGRRMKRIKPLFDSISYRVGIDREAFWLFDGKALRVVANTSAFDSVVQVEDVIVAYVNKNLSYGFPRAKLHESAEGRLVISWFEKNWPNHTGVNAYRYKTLHRSWIRRLTKMVVKTICVVGFVVMIISFAGYADILWQEYNAAKALKELSKKTSSGGQTSPSDADQRYGVHALSGPAAQDFLDRLTNSHAK